MLYFLGTLDNTRFECMSGPPFQMCIPSAEMLLVYEVIQDAVVVVTGMFFFLYELKMYTLRHVQPESMF
jgi:hypothetical protein